MKKQLVRSYIVIFEKDTHSGGYTAEVPALGKVTQGNTLQEAQYMAQDLIVGELQYLQDKGLPVPTPDAVPVGRNKLVSVMHA